MFSPPVTLPAGPIPIPYSGERLRIEHWVVAERQGQTVARNMRGRRERFIAPPFFSRQHYDVSIDYVGHASSWDTIEQNGEASSYDVSLRFRKNGRALALATIFRDRESLQVELGMEQRRSP